MIHDFAERASSATDASVVIRELIQAAKRLTGARRVDFFFEGSVAVGSESGLRGFEVEESRCSAEDAPLAVNVGTRTQNWGNLKLHGIHKKNWRGESSHLAVRPLKTICTLAALALDTISTSQLFDALEFDDLDESKIIGDLNVSNPLADSLHDATFLHVILPYALSQAHRHHEPTSILYAGLDRVSAMHEMFGAEMVNRAVNHVGEIVINRLRASDVVSRMEDDRLLAMLPNATSADAHRIAMEIQALVEESCASLPDMPPLTVSIGVASFPTHSKDVDSLLVAADEAMSRAQLAGRNRVVVAEVGDRYEMRSK